MQELYDKSIEYDISHLPEYIKEIIQKLEAEAEINDWLNYNADFSYLEAQLKSLVIANRLTEGYFKILTRKYGWYCVIKLEMFNEYKPNGRTYGGQAGAKKGILII